MPQSGWNERRVLKAIVAGLTLVLIGMSAAGFVDDLRSHSGSEISIYDVRIALFRIGILVSGFMPAFAMLAVVARDEEDRTSCTTSTSGSSSGAPEQQ